MKIMNCDFYSYLKEIIAQHEIELVHHALSLVNFWDNLHSMPSDNKHDLIHGILTKMPAGIDEKSSEALLYVESVVFLTMSISHEPIHHDEFNLAMKATSFQKYVLSNNHDANLSQKIIGLQYFAQQLERAFDVPEPVNIGYRTLKTNSPPNIAAKLHNNAAIYVPYPLSHLTSHFDIVCNEKHQTSILINGTAAQSSELSDLTLWLAHEMCHHHQRFAKTPELDAQFKSGITRRINKLMPNTAYYTLMEERQAYVFEGLMADMSQGKLIRHPIEIILDKLTPNINYTARFIENIRNFHGLQKPSHRLSSSNPYKLPKVA